MVNLRDVEDRWERDGSFRKMRDRVAFHVDTDVVEKGLGELLKDRRDVVLIRGAGSKAVNSPMTLGLEAQVNGLEMNLDAYGKFVGIVSDDHGVVSSAIEEAFILATRAAGIPIGDE